VALRKQASNPLDIVTEVLGIVGSTVSVVGEVVKDSHLPSAVTHMLGVIDGALHNVPKDVGTPANWYSPGMEDIGTPFVEAFLRGGLGVDPDFEGGVLHWPRNGKASWEGVNPAAFKSDTTQGIRELKRLVGFCIAMPFAWTGVEMLLKFALGQRFGGALARVVGEIPTEMGISWALGMAMSSIFETAAGRQIEELVNVQLHPNRLDMMTLRAMARQHRITPEQFWAGLDLLGYPDDLKSLILLMDTQQLPITDLQTLYVYGQIDRDGIKAYLEHVGFSEVDVEHLLTVYVDKAETQASSMFRTELRTAYLEYRISRSQIRSGLAQLLHNPQVPPVLTGDSTAPYDNAPDQVKMVVDLEVAALDFELQHGRRMQSTATLKQLYQTKHLTLHELEKRLMQAGYSEADANQLITTWQSQGVPGKPGLTSAKILAYLASGTLTRAQALTRLLDAGVNQPDAVFLVDNPATKTGPYYAPFSETTVTQAYLDGALSVEQAVAALERLGYSADAATEVMRIVQYEQTHQLSPLTLTAPVRQPGEPSAVWQRQLAGYHQAELFEEAIRTQFNAGALSDQQTITMLESLGLSQSDAGFIWYSWYIAKNGKAPGPPS